MNHSNAYQCFGKTQFLKAYFDSVLSSWGSNQLTVKPKQFNNTPLLRLENVRIQFASKGFETSLLSARSIPQN